MENTRTVNWKKIVLYTSYVVILVAVYMFAYSKGIADTETMINNLPILNKLYFLA